MHEKELFCVIGVRNKDLLISSVTAIIRWLLYILMKLFHEKHFIVNRKTKNL